MNRLHGLWSLGTVVGGVGASQVAGLGVSLRTHLFAVTIILLVVVLFVGTNLLRDDEYVIEQSIGEPVGPPISGHPGTPTSFPTRWLRGPLVLFAVVGACSVAMEVTSSDWAAFRLSDDFGAAAAVAGLAYVAFTSGMTVGRFGGDSMIVRFGQRRVADVGIAMTIAGLAVSSFVPNEFIVMLGYLAAGLGVATQFPRLYDEAAKFPGRPGAGLGALTGGSRVALLFTPLAVGSLADIAALGGCRNGDRHAACCRPVHAPDQTRSRSDDDDCMNCASPDSHRLDIDLEPGSLTTRSAPGGRRRATSAQS